MRKLSLVIAGILGAGGPLISQAATLGDARVQSYLTEPLEVSVPLARSSNEPLDEIRVQLAPPAFYEQAGVPLESLPANLVFSVETRGGQDYVLIRSRGPVRDPILSILLEVRSPEGRMIREYNLLLDPPSSGARSESAARDVPTSAPAPRAASSTWERVAPASDLDLDDSYTVQRGDTLSGIASRYAADGEDIRPIMQAIIDANPDAFVNGNGNALMADAELKVPSAQPTADDEAASDDARGPAFELIGPEERAESAEAEAGDSEAAVSDAGPTRENLLPAIDGPTRAELERQAALDQEELESARAENESLTEELRSLTEQIDSVKLSIDERDSRISELEAAVEQAQQEKAALEQQNAELDELKGNFWIEWGKYLVGGLGLIVLALLIALGLRRNRRNDEPAMPSSQQGSFTPSVGSEADSDRSNVAGAMAIGTGAAAASTAAAGSDSDENAEIETETAGNAAAQDPLDPQTALDEARMLESFNLNQQAIELLQDSLSEHPGHDGLQEAVARLQNGDAPQPAEEDDFFATGSFSTEDTDSTSADADAIEPMPSGDLDQEDAVTPIGESDSSLQGGLGEGEAEQGEVETSPAGVIDWDDDLDNMLATPDSEPEPRQADDSDDVMDFDDSYALETPDTDEPASTDDNAGGEEIEFDLPEPGESTESEFEAGDDEAGAVPTWSERQGSDNLSLQDAPEEEVEKSTVVDSADEAQDDAAGQDAVDTRVSLAEAFLDVGDRESFEMIESELKEEGATDALQRLDELKKRYG